MYHGVGQTHGAYGPLMAYRDGVLGEYFMPLGQEAAAEDAAEAAADDEDKKKMLMYGGVAVGVLALGAVIYFASKKR